MESLVQAYVRYLDAAVGGRACRRDDCSGVATFADWIGLRVGFDVSSDGSATVRLLGDKAGVAKIDELFSIAGGKGNQSSGDAGGHDAGAVFADSGCGSNSPGDRSQFDLYGVGGTAGTNVVDSGMPVGGSSSEVVGSDVKKRGKWYYHNKRRKQARKDRREPGFANNVPLWRRGSVPVGSCETVVSGCPSYGAALSDAEREAKDSLARRRAAENEVAVELARLKLASLRDEKKCADYAALKQQRIVQWTNESIAKSQASLDKCKSIDPGSSASQYDIRQQAKENVELKRDVQLLRDGIKRCVPHDAENILLSVKLAAMQDAKIGGFGDVQSEASSVYEEPDLGEFMSKDCYANRQVCQEHF